MGRRPAPHSPELLGTAPLLAPSPSKAISVPLLSPKQFLCPFFLPLNQFLCLFLLPPKQFLCPSPSSSNRDQIKIWSSDSSFYPGWRHSQENPLRSPLTLFSSRMGWNLWGLEVLEATRGIGMDSCFTRKEDCAVWDLSWHRGFGEFEGLTQTACFNPWNSK